MTMHKISKACLTIQIKASNFLGAFCLLHYIIKDYKTTIMIFLAKWLRFLKHMTMLSVFVLCGKSLAQKVDFNHLFAVLPEDMCLAIHSNTFLKDTLFAFDHRTTTSGDGSSWKGTYLYSIENYLEFFDSKNIDAPIGYAGIAYYVEKKGELALIKAKLGENFADSITLKTKITIEKKPLPWFQLTSIADTTFLNNALIFSWIMEYDKRYFDYYKLPYKKEILSVKNYVSDHVNSKNLQLAQKIIGIDLLLNVDEMDFYSKYLSKMGFNLQGKIQKEFVNDQGFKIKINARKNKKSTVRKIHFSLNKKCKFRKIFIANGMQVVLNNQVGTIEFDF